MYDFENLILFILMIVGIMMVLVISYITQMLGKIIRKTKQLDKTDFDKNKEYYREILDKYSTLIIVR